MPAIVAAALKKIALLLATDKRTWKAVFWIIGIILMLLFLPVIVILALTQQPEQSRIQPDISSYLTGLSPEKMENMQDFQNAGVQVADAMAAVGMRKDTIKAQLIYISAFETVEEIDFQEYANLFAAAPDDGVLIESVNEKFGSNIVLEDFCRSYIWVLNVSMNQYMFSDPATKNAADLAAWAGGEPLLVIVSFARKRASGNRCSIYYKCIKHMFPNLCRPFRRQANWEAIASGGTPLSPLPIAVLW